MTIRMATNQDQSDSIEFDDLDVIESSGDRGDDGFIELEPGEEITGVVTAFEPTASYNGIAEIDGRRYRLNATMRKKLCNRLVVGTTIGIRKADSKDSFEDDDGEEVEYYPREIAVGGDAE